MMPLFEASGIRQCGRESTFLDYDSFSEKSKQCILVQITEWEKRAHCTYERKKRFTTTWISSNQMNFKRYCACVLQHSVLFAILFQSILSSFFCFFFSVFVLNSTHVPGKIDQKCNNCPCVRVRLYVMGVK